MVVAKSLRVTSPRTMHEPLRARPNARPAPPGSPSARDRPARAPARGGEGGAGGVALPGAYGGSQHELPAPNRACRTPTWDGSDRPG